LEISPKVTLSAIILRREGNLNYRTVLLTYSHDVEIWHYKPTTRYAATRGNPDAVQCTIRVRVPEDLAGAVKSAAAAKYLSASAYIRQAVADRLKRDGFSAILK
jgi:hypothetical protein